MNAHAIHLDRSHCRDIEGYRNLLVHGPLSLFLMLEVLGRLLRAPTSGMAWSTEDIPTSSQEIVRIEYRNLAKLFADEEMTVHVKPLAGQAPSFDGREAFKWQVWIEDPDGRLAVSSTVTTRHRD